MQKGISKSTVMKIAFAVAFVIAAVVLVVFTKSNASSERTFDGSEKMYINLGACGDSWWTNSGCYHRVYLFGDDTAWASLAETSESGIYEATIPEGTYTNIIIARCSTAETTWSSGQVYNQTGDIELDMNANYISYFKGANSTEATWSTYGSVETTSTPDATEEVASTATPVETDVIYVNLGACGDSWWTNEGCYHRAYLFGSSDTAWASLTETSVSGIYTFTLPSGSFTEIILCRCSTATTTWSSGQIYNKTGDMEFKSGYNYISYFKGSGSTDITWGTYGSEATATPAATSTATTTPTPTSTSSSEYGLADDIQDGVILHAFNWSYDTIKANLANIAAAGYTSVQTSPVQQPKDYSSSYTDVSSNWWKLYQPVSFSVSSNTWLGTKDDLTELCSEADKYGIKIICDIVANHMGSSSDSSTALNSAVATYESTLYNNYSTYFHSFTDCNDGSIVNVVWGNIGMPDLNTSNSYVQGRVISLLKECIDCGVDGFRFDAAKHIETSSDGSYASSFWSNVIGTAKSYASSSAGVDLYCYGEILNTPGTGRSWSSYTGLMSIIDNKSSDAVLKNVYYNNASDASSYYYNTQQSPSKLVLWAESHDTYMGNSGSAGISNTSSVDTSSVDKAWAIVASRASASALYFARPGSSMCNVGSTAWKYTEVEAVNDFHNSFIGASEYLSYSGNVVLNERYFTKGATTGGAVLVNVSGTSTSVSNMTVNTLGDGTYTDKITNNTFTVSGGKISGSIGSTGIAVIY